MQAVISLRARGRGAFALRKDLKAGRDTVCEVKRFKENEYGTILQTVGKFPTMSIVRSICVVQQSALRDHNLDVFYEFDWRLKLFSP